MIFLAEAFTRRAVMRTLAKAGFNQSYTYFTWQQSRWELEQYVGELAYVSQDYFRPNFFANTPDILTEQLQHGGRAAFESRLVLAATLSPTYGIYSGYEWVEQTAVKPGQRGVPGLREVRGQGAHAAAARRCSGSSACSTRRAARTPRCSTSPTSRSWTPQNDGLIAYIKQLRR